METLIAKQMRLRRELEEAYGAWMIASEFCARSMAGSALVDTSGCPEATRVKWFDYLAAKERLVLAYAEHPMAA
jgi:hypothetical protein